MKKIFNVLLWVLMFAWQFPQEILGLIFFIFLSVNDRIIDICRYKTSYTFYVNKFPGGLSLGRYVFINPFERDLILHEWGHSIQSIILGPFYLIVIGIPSFIWNHIYRSSWKKSYYWFWTERWANKLGGV